MSSCLGCVGVRCLHMVEYCVGMSSLGSPLLHSLFLNAWASSNSAKLGVISEVGSGLKVYQPDPSVYWPAATFGRVFYIWTCTFPNRICRISLPPHSPPMLQHSYIPLASFHIDQLVFDQSYPFSIGWQESHLQSGLTGILHQKWWKLY